MRYRWHQSSSDRSQIRADQVLLVAGYRSPDRSGLERKDEAFRGVALSNSSSAASHFENRDWSGNSQCDDTVIVPLPPEDREMIDAKLGAGVVGEALPCKPIDDACAYFPLEEKTATYLAITGRRAGQIEKLGVARVTPTSGGLSWRCEFSPSLVGYIQQNEIGDLEMPSVSDLREGIIVITTPPMPFIPKGMKPGESCPFSQTVMVNAPGYPLWNYSGALSGTDTYVGSYRVTVPAGTFDTVLVRINAEGQVGPAHTKDTAYYFFAAGEGLVAMISQENATAFWIIHIDTSAGRVMRTRGVSVSDSNSGGKRGLE